MSVLSGFTARPRAVDVYVCVMIVINLSVGYVVWFGFVWNGTGPRHRNGLLSLRPLRFGSFLRRATYWNMRA